MPDPSQATRVTVRASDPGIPIDPRIYGHFLEEFGRMISGGLFPEPGSRTRTSGIGYRQDAWEACRDLHPILVRWPGGCYADTYHWEQFVGLNRPRRPRNRYWGRLGSRFGPRVHEELGTIEFLELCRDWACEPYLCANAGTGTPEEAARWVEFVARHPSLPRVRLWSVGNEQFGFWEPGHRCARRYAQRYLLFREAMRAADPTLQAVANGADTYDLAWNERLLGEAGDRIDLLSIHVYLPQDYRPWNLLRRPSGSVQEWYDLLALDRTLLWKLDTIAAQVRHLAGRPIPLAVDEWNLWWDFFQSVRPRPALREALATALHLMVFQQRADLVRVANLSSLLNIIAPPVLTGRDSCARTSVFHVFRLFTDHAQGIAIPSAVHGPGFGGRGVRGVRPVRGVPFIAASATIDLARSSVSTFLVNRHHEEALPVQLDYENIQPSGEARHAWIGGPSMLAENLPGLPEQIERGLRPLPSGQAQELLLPPRSVSVLVQPLAAEKTV
ncbi:MAG: hypothetical protein HYV63_33060 [Candidatus Schekmanbacteria bacterium]|nr:hypothetical protein [Candidatus Schekmanbacteria bacterium]